MEINKWKVPYPEDNPKNEKIAELGRQLFFDKDLSVDNTISCASCHLPELAFADTVSFSKGVYNRHAGRNTPSIINSAFNDRYMGEGQVPTLEMQVLLPLLDHHEMGADMKSVIEELKPRYNKRANELFGRDFDPYVLTRAIANFERTLNAYTSPFDLFYYGKDSSAVSKEVIKGWKLFSGNLNCVACHPAPRFTSYDLKNNGIYKDYLDEGRFKVTGRYSDKGRFKIPSLRNVALTYPYMHDGSMNSLNEVLDHYERGGQNHPNQDSLIKGFVLNQEDRKALTEFFESLTDVKIEDF